ncbi:hypothetical protein [Vreelandella neptunia]|nr:hypothetical protein [Halomonas neptunia]
MSDEDAWMLYKGNWRYVYQEHLSEEEKRLIERLTKKYGNW